MQHLIDISVKKGLILHLHFYYILHLQQSASWPLDILSLLLPAVLSYDGAVNEEKGEYEDSVAQSNVLDLRTSLHYVTGPVLLIIAHNRAH